jgi:hypothetical protein
MALPCALRALVYRTNAPIASPHPTFVTIAKRPSFRARDKTDSAGDLGARSMLARCGHLARRANHLARRKIMSSVEQLLCRRYCENAVAELNRSHYIGSDRATLLLFELFAAFWIVDAHATKGKFGNANGLFESFVT